MRDPLGPPTWLLYVVALGWMFALGVWVERNRLNGSKDLAEDVAALQVQNDELLATIDDLVAAAAQDRIEIDTRRNAAMRAHPSAALRLVHGGGA